MTRKFPILIAAVLLSTASLASCNSADSVPGGITPALPSLTPGPPTATPEPLAAVVNDQALLLRTFQEELDRFESAQGEAGIDLATLGDYAGRILDGVIDRMLLAQAALESGVTVGPAELEARIEALVTDVGSADQLLNWIEETGYTSESFKAALFEELLAAKMVAMIVENIPEQVEQVHASHILVASREEALALVDRLADGEDFSALARMYSQDASTRPAGGDLGWFPEGYLLTPEVERAAFSLQPGEHSEIIQSALGFHLVLTHARGEIPLTPDAERYIRERTVEEWLAAKRERAEIQILIPR